MAANNYHYHYHHHLEKQKKKERRFGKILLYPNQLLNKMSIYLNAYGYSDDDYLESQSKPKPGAKKQQVCISIYNEAEYIEKREGDMLEIYCDIENFHETQYSPMRWLSNAQRHYDDDEDQIHVDITQYFLNIRWVIRKNKTAISEELGRYSVNLKNVEYYQTNG